MEHVKALAAEWEARVDGPKKDLALESSGDLLMRSFDVD